MTNLNGNSHSNQPDFNNNFHNNNNKNSYQQRGMPQSRSFYNNGYQNQPMPNQFIPPIQNQFNPQFGN